MKIPQFNHLMIAIGKLDAVAFEAWVFPATRIARHGLPARTLGPYQRSSKAFDQLVISMLVDSERAIIFGAMLDFGVNRYFEYLATTGECFSCVNSPLQ
ncbi:MAG: hypothetical protein HOL03_10380 [Acidiferrobacteraceae bacterium]|jgi:hypothetical protein|nr:hypothetical protein [Acidiferrobacteraceae bacterium]MBT3972931.1 hypothetical protein [Acidiferrobacteraceae bacterium]MBT5345282.1 hypothetical protein [Acidiferrobacteraceae bacterium]MBT5982075.1 hypothetical protein [Acidiferrobacteraceae bacterium]